MSNKTILMEAARKKCRERHTQKIHSINYDFIPIFPNCTFWEHHEPVRYIDRIPMDTSFTVKVCLGCPRSKMPTYVDGGDPFDRMRDRFDFQALNNCNGAECEWYNTCE